MLSDNLQEKDAGAAPEQVVELLDAEEEQKFVFMQKEEDVDFWDDENVIAEMNGIIYVQACRSD